MRKAREQEPSDLDRRIGQDGYVSQSKRTLWGSCRGPSHSDQMSGSPGELLKRFQYLDLDLLNVGSRDRERAVRWCREVLLSPSQGENLLDSLLAEVQRVRTAGGYIDRDRLIRRLSGRYLLQGDQQPDTDPDAQPPQEAIALMGARHVAAVAGQAQDGKVSRERLAGLPPDCRERIKALERHSLRPAYHLTMLLSQSSSRAKGVLSRFATDPPGWLAEAPAVAWEALGEFMAAHDIAGHGLMWERAVRAGSVRSSLYVTRLAIEATLAGDSEEGEGWLSQVPDEYPPLPAGRAFVAGDPDAVVEEVMKTPGQDSEDADLARLFVVMLSWAYWELSQFNALRDMLRSANRRFPGRAYLLAREANSVLGMADQAGLDTPGGRELLREAAELATSSRDCFRLWNGPAHLAVSLAMRALSALGDAERIVELASVGPEGQATASEANDPNIKRQLVLAYWGLGRHDDVRTFSFEGLDPFDRAFMSGMMSATEGNDMAASRMRRLLALADDEQSHRRALMGLAMVGEVDEDAMAEVSEADAAFFRGFAALNRNESPQAIRYLRPFSLETPLHAHNLAFAYDQAGKPGEAVDVLLDAAGRFQVVSLYSHAVDVLMEQGNLPRARLLVTEALARDPSKIERQQMMMRLVGIAHGLEDWPSMESYARSAASEFPQNERAAWMVVYTLYRQGRNQDAWDYFLNKDLHPFSQEMAQLATAVSQAAETPRRAAEILLRIASTYSDSEEVVGHVLAVLMTGSDRIRLTDEQRMVLNEVKTGFVSRFPQSDRFREFSTESPEEVIAMLTEPLRASAHDRHGVIVKVRYGRMPYGALRLLRSSVPYATLLTNLTAGWLTAVPTDENRRERERQAAEQALGGKVAADTSVATLTLKSGLDVGGLGQSFKTVLVADELVIDAREAVTFARQLGTATVGYDAVLNRTTYAEIEEGQRQAMAAEAESVLETLGNWRSISSGTLPSPFPPGKNERHLRPWDASIRIAASEGCALWCDDVALRSLADEAGVLSFGTWALYEVLSSTAEGAWLPPSTEVKMALLRGHIADIPITLGGLAQNMDDSNDMDTAAELFLFRPRAWRENPAVTFDWYLNRVRTLKRGASSQRVAQLLHAACCGWGVAVPDWFKTTAIGGALGATIHTVSEPEMTPVLLEASRQASREIDPRDERDPLPEAIKASLETFSNLSIREETAARTLMTLFSQVDTADLRIVTSILIGDR